MTPDFPQTSKKVNGVGKTRRICDLKLTSTDIPGAVIVNEQALESGQWRN